MFVEVTLYNIVRVSVYLLATLVSLFYVTDEGYRFLHRG